VAETERKEEAEEKQQDDTTPAQKSLSRPSAEEIFKQVATNARQELQRPSIALALSGFGAGMFMGLSALGTAITLRILGASAVVFFVSRMFYPLGFIITILGRSQLFTENTLYPVALVLAEKREIWNTLRLWSVVLPANVLGAFAFGLLISDTRALEPATQLELSGLGAAALGSSGWHVFWSAVIAGWIIALAAWLVSGSHSITGSVMVIWMLTFVVGLGGFSHCVASSCEVFVTILTNHAEWSQFPGWFFPTVAGNICGGVGLVTILEYGQVMHGKVVEEVIREGEREQAQRENEP